MAGRIIRLRFPYVLILIALVSSFAILLSGCTGEQALHTPTASGDGTAFETPTDLPDLVVSSIQLQLETDKGCPLPDSPHQFIIRIENVGSLDAGPFAVQLNGDQHTSIPGLRRGQSEILNLSGFGSSANVSVDSLDEVTERSENNNHAFKKFELPTFPAACLATATPEVLHGKQLGILAGHTAKVWAVEFSPDGDLLASGSVDNSLRLWRVKEMALLRTMQGHPFPILSIAFSPDGNTLATGSTDGTIRQWRVSNGQLSRTLNGHAGWVTSLEYSFDSNYILSSAQDFTVRIWRNTDGKPVQIIDEGMTSVNSVVYSPDGTFIAWGEADGTVRVRTISGIWLYRFKETAIGVTSVAISPDGDILVAGYEDGMLRFWRLSDVEMFMALKMHALPISALRFSKSGKWLAAGSEDGTISLWRIENWMVESVPRLIYSDHTGAVNDLDFSPDGSVIASGGDDATVRLWSVPEEE